MEGKETQDILITQYKIMWTEDKECIKDEVVDEEETEGDEIEVDGWPRDKRGHRWVKVNEAGGWAKGEREELCQVMGAYCDFSSHSGAKAKGEIFTRSTNWQGVMLDIWENIHDDPSIVVTGWRRKQGKTRGEMWEEKERSLKETILTRRSEEVARVRWTSPKMVYEEETTLDSLDAGETLDESNVIVDVLVDSPKKRTVSDTMIKKTERDQSQREVRGRTTPYVFLPLRELEKLRTVIRKTLSD